MALVKCGNGHYFDDRKYSACPQCCVIPMMPVTHKKKETLYGLKVDEDDKKNVKMDQEGDKYRKMPDEDPVTVHYAETGQEEKNIGRGFVTGWLVCRKGLVRGRDYRLFDSKNFVGRSARMDVCIPEDTHISRETHCAVVFEKKKGCFYLVPGKELTYLNGKMLDEAALLSENDVITIGETELIFIPFCKEGRSWI